MTKQKTNYHLVNKIIALYNQCDNTTIDKGKNWYFKANKTALRIAKKTGYSLEVTSAIIALLSPAVSWPNNKLQAYHLLKAYQHSKKIDGLTLTTYKQQIKKALKLLDNPLLLTADIFGKRPFKTMAFYENIVNPNNPDFVTLDRHIFNALKLDMLSGNKTQYYNIVDAFKVASEKISNIVPCQLQAVLWLNEKNSKIPF